MVELGSSKSDPVSNNAKQADAQSEGQVDHSKKLSTDSSVRQRRSKREGRTVCLKKNG